MITATNHELRSGYTTGACAAAAVKAALLLLLQGWQGETVTIPLPDGGNMQLPVYSLLLNGNQAIAGVVKDAGDDPDVTHGLTIMATVELTDGQPIKVAQATIPATRTAKHATVTWVAGPGVGRVTKPGLAVPVGEPAINPGPRQMIEEAISGLLPAGTGLRVTLSVPGGEQVAQRTFNPRLGITGGISILGTTGWVRPMSREAYLESLIPQIDQAVAMDYTELLLTPGGKGVRWATERGLPPEQVIQTSNYVGDLLDACAVRQVQRVILLGHLGKLIKLAAGIFNTHSHVADARRETLAAYAGLAGAKPATIARIMQLNTMEAAVLLLKETGLQAVGNTLAAAAARRSTERVGGEIEVGTIFYTLNGQIIGWSPEAAAIGGGWPWRVELK